MKRKRDSFNEYSLILNKIENPNNEYFRILKFLKQRYGRFNHHQMKMILKNSHFQRQGYEIILNDIDLDRHIYQQIFDEEKENPVLTYLITSYLDFDQIKDHLDLNYCWPSLIRHDIPLSFILSNWRKFEKGLINFGEIKFDKYLILSSHPEITNSNIENNLNVPWIWSSVFNRPRFDLKRWLDKVFPFISSDDDLSLLKGFLNSINLNLDVVKILMTTRLEKYFVEALPTFFRNPLKRDLNFACRIILDAYRRYRSRKRITAIYSLSKRVPSEIVMKIVD